jgi:FAD/FMN-containing dehydrogenase
MSVAWQNWSGSVACQPTMQAQPRGLDELCRLVRAARQVRVVGTGHSFVPLCASDDLLLNLDRLDSAIEEQPDERQAWIPAGWKISALGAPLQAQGLGLANQGDIDTQALAGAIGTGTHGTGPGLGNLAAMVTGLRLVGADGDLVEWTDPSVLRALRLSMGMFGVVTAVRLRLLPAYRLHERIWREPIDTCLSRLDERIAATRHFEFFWAPPTDDCLMKALHPTDAVDQPGREGERVDWSHRIFPSIRERRFNECEYCMPAASGPACFAALRQLMRERFPSVAWPIEYRTLAGDDALLSSTQGAASVTLSLHEGAEHPHEPFFREAEAICRAHGGRPHWGKWHSLARNDIDRLYPGAEAFRALRRRHDPKGKFLNDYLRPLFG